MSTWYLEGFFGDDGSMRKLPLKDFPQIVGRDQALDCSIVSPSVSRKHAKVDEDGDHLCITDLHSSNGTFVNHERIGCTTDLNHGDVVHFGELELRIIDHRHSNSIIGYDEVDNSSQTKYITQAQLSETFPAGVHELEELLEKRQIPPVFQPILKANGLKPDGYELLGRGASPKLSKSPLALFNIAESVGLEVELSSLMRSMGIAAAAKYGLKGNIWVNTHPSEMKDLDKVLSSLKSMRKKYPKVPLIFEVHEQCVADAESLSGFKAELKKMSILFAFDDFGVGQSRLMELVDAKPDIIKFDKVLIEGIDQADQPRINLLRHLKEMASELNILALAECVENKGEYEVCDKIGFDLYQGYYFAKPQPPQNYKG